MKYACTLIFEVPKTTKKRLEKTNINKEYTESHVFNFFYQSLDKRVLCWDTWQAPFGDSRSRTESSVGSAIHAGAQCLRSCRVLEVGFCCSQSCNGSLGGGFKHLLFLPLLGEIIQFD